MSEDGRPDAHEGGAFFDRDREVVAHAHGELGEVALMRGGQLVAQFPKPFEMGTDFFEILIVGRHRHEPANLEMRQGDEFAEGGTRFRNGKSEFGVVVRDIDLKEDLRGQAEFSREATDLSGEVGGVDAVNEGAMREDLARFILLQMPDEMLLHLGGEFRHLSEQFLHLVFPEGALAGLNDLPHGLGGPGFRHGN